MGERNKLVLKIVVRSEEVEDACGKKGKPKWVLYGENERPVVERDL